MMRKLLSLEVFIFLGIVAILAAFAAHKDEVTAGYVAAKTR